SSCACSADAATTLAAPTINEIAIARESQPDGVVIVVPCSMDRAAFPDITMRKADATSERSYCHHDAASLILRCRQSGANAGSDGRDTRQPHNSACMTSQAITQGSVLSR